MPFFKGTITKRVLAAINQRIAQAEAEFQAALDDLSGAHAQALMDLTRKHESELVELENKAVDSIVGKILS